MGIAVAGPLAQHDGVGQGCSAGRDVYRRSTGEIETAHLKYPSRRVPRPACNRVIDDGRPDEHEDYAGKHAASLCCSANSECGTVSTVSWVPLQQKKGGRGTDVMAANMPWYIANTRSGILELPTLGAPNTFLKPMFRRSPMYLPALWEKVKE
jgi:hypothetical protein